MKIFIRISLLICLVFTCAYKQEPEQIIMTVNGPIPASTSGITLSHEHVLVDFIGADSITYSHWNKLEVIKKVKPFLLELKDYHVSTLMECTPAYLGRDPWLLKMLSEETGLHLLTNTGYYGARKNRFIPAEILEMSASDLAGIWVDEFENGIEGSDIKPGFIKIGVDGTPHLSEEHLKLIKAAALAHQKTGLAIASHTGPDGPALEQISVLQEYGIDPSAFIWVHAQQGSLEGNIKAAELGAWISLDNVNHEIQPGSLYDINWYAERILALKESGFLNHILLSHDAGWYKPGEENGGSFRGFTNIFTDLIPALKERGFSQDDIKLLLEINPRNAFSLRKII